MLTILLIFTLLLGWSVNSLRRPSIPCVCHADESVSLFIALLQQVSYKTMIHSRWLTILVLFGRTDIPRELVSAIEPFVKPPSRGTEVYEEDKLTTPLHQPKHKLEAKAQVDILYKSNSAILLSSTYLQVTGEAVYPSDEPLPPQGLNGAIVYSSQCAVLLVSIDTSAALATPGL